MDLIVLPLRGGEEEVAIVVSEIEAITSWSRDGERAARVFLKNGRWFDTTETLEGILGGLFGEMAQDD